MKSISVPGKVMLSGEYSVLYGGSAVMLPLSRQLMITDDDIAPLPASAVIRQALMIDISETKEFESKSPLETVRIDYSQFRSSEGAKLGLGSSAAEAVGIVALRFERAGLPWDMYSVNIASYADAAHRKAQGGIGSGADIATCAFRMPLKFGKADNQITIEPIEPITSIEHPPLNLIWSGEPSDTRDMVNMFRDWVETDAKSEPLLDKLAQASHLLTKSWFRVEKSELFESIDRFMNALEECSKAAGILLKTKYHEEIEAWAESKGGKAKPTGAGGGDMILMIGDLPLDELKREIIPIKLEAFDG